MSARQAVDDALETLRLRKVEGEHLTSLDYVSLSDVEEILGILRGAVPEEIYEWAIQVPGVSVFTCRDEEHAEGMVHSTSPVIGPMEGRRIVRRTSTVPGPWEER